MNPNEIRGLAHNPELMEVARRAIQNELADRRDHEISVLRNNGLVIKHSNGEHSDIIRMSPEEAMQIGLRAIADYL